MGRGELFKNPNGTNAVRIDLASDPVAGKRRWRQETYRFREVAESRLTAWLAEIERGYSEPT